ACGSDPTAAIEQFKYLTGNRGCAAVGPAYHSWYAYEIVFREADAQPILGAINQLGVDWPDVAAAQVAIGDAYAMLAQCVGHPDWRLLGPFTAREFLGRAEAAYRQAMSRSTVPTIVAGLLKVRAELGRDLETPVNNRLFGQAVMDTPAVLQALATSYALSGDFDQAFYYERTARDLPPAPAQPIVEYDRGDVTLIPGTRGVLIEYPYGQGGASATVQSFGFVPQSRLSAPDYGPAFEQFLYLSESHRDYVHGGVGQLAIWCGRIDWDSPLCQAFQTEPGGPLADDQLDFLQDLWRYWGQFAVAATLGDQWAELRPGSGLARERLAEIRFLTRDWNRAAEAAKQAVANYPGGDRPYEYFDEGLASSTGPGWAQLVAGAAERMAGQPRAAQVLLTEVVDLQLRFDYDGMTGNEWVAGYQANLESFLYLELGQAAYELRDYPRAISQFLESVEARAQTANVGGVAEQGLSLSYLATNQPDKALEWAQVALAWDPYSPLYAEAVADAKRALSEQVGLPDTPQARAEMMAAYREALALNPSLFSAWNNLGVLLAQAGQTEEAIEAFHQALAARKNYPLAWFNLGVTEASQGGVAAFLRSQGALGQAGLLNRELKDRDPIWAFDNEVYASGLDVSKPIPADWQLSGTIRTTSTGITIGLIIIIALRLGWALGSDWLTGRWREGALRRWQGRPGGLARIVAWRPHPAITTVISAGALLWLGGANGVGEWVLCALVVAAILSLHAFTPHLTSRLPVRHTSYPPGSLMTLIGLPFGVGFAPPAPLVGTGVNGLGVVSSRIVARVGVATVGLLAVLFALGAGLTGVPTARTATTLALILAGSALTPIPPLDGSTVKLNRGADLAVTIVMIAATILFTLQLL
ncbi:MAG: tetratricopeptide repeat protein, partial [Propionibacteriaceae bacterium]|nr:tetratricopeptide repeat protein [Propionibacteriaceae bacterium]